MGLPLVIENLRVTGDRGTELLTIDRLEIAPGATVAVRGASGAGKSTLLYAMAGLMAVSAGQVHWGATDLADMSSDARGAFRRRSIGFVFQDFLLFEELTAAANAALTASFAPPDDRQAIQTRARDLLVHMGLPADAADRRINSFSGGERQRIAVARALAAEPAILLADEPTASLDGPTASRLIDDLLALAKDRGTTVIAASHDPTVIERMGQVVTLDHGRLVAQEPAHA